MCPFKEGNSNSTQTPGWNCFIEQIQQRLAVMAIGRSTFNRQHQTIVIDYRMLLIAKYRFVAFSIEFQSIN